MKKILMKDSRPVRSRPYCIVRTIFSCSDDQITEFWKNKYETEARRCWDVFYKVRKYSSSCKL
eukprot:758777-Hanusia_phi.AAC.2